MKWDATAFNRPQLCNACNGRMIFKGVGEYKCETCGEKGYDDYGVVRLYIEKHGSSTAAEIEQKTGVSQKVIRELLKQDRLEVAVSSKTFIRCELCGVDIRSGRFCKKCEQTKAVYQKEKDKAKEKKMKVIGMGSQTAEGNKRFHRDN